MSTTATPSTGADLESYLGRLRAFENLDPSAGPAHIHKLVGSSKRLLAAHLFRKHQRSVLYITANEDRAEAARQDLKIFLGDQSFHLIGHQTDPYQSKHPDTETVGGRLEALAHFARGGEGVLVVSVRSLMEKVVGKDTLAKDLLRIKPGDDVDIDQLTQRLSYLGYRRAQAVEEVGDFAVRGGIVDIYSLASGYPIRLEIDYDEVTSLREFDVHTQRSVRTLDHVTIFPRFELLLTPERIEVAVKELSAIDEEAGRELEGSFATEVFPEGVERIAGRLGQNLESVLEYLPGNSVVVLEEPGLINDQVESFWEDILAAHSTFTEAMPYINEPEELFVSPDMVQERLSAYPQVRISDFTRESAGAKLVSVTSSPPESFGRKIDFWRDYLSGLKSEGYHVLIFSDNEGQKRRLHELLVDEGIELELPIGVLAAGFVLEEARLAVLTDHEFFGRSRRRARSKRFKSGFGLKELNSLKRGSFVVHVEHGIARYIGLTRLEVNGHLTDVLELHYHGGDKLYVPVDQLDLIQRYSSEEGKTPVLSRLGGTGWGKTKSKAKKAIQEMAGELLRNYALRKAHPGHAFPADTSWQRELEGSFPYDETPDQLKAMEETKKDMEAPHPMDRLICGDVGYGKTEVAIRAAFKTVMDGKQVAVLVPTTILAEQHAKTFKDRYDEFPVRVDMMSRFRSPKEIKEIKAKTNKGELDVIIGTHALLAKDVSFPNLGLIVIDEEQRFGVAHKERLRSLRANIDVLTLTATPIPRTLNLSLLGARDITIIQTPPIGRMPIATEIADFDRELIRDALLREADRGGQSFFVHNRVHSIHSIANYLRKLCPQLTFGVAHGQMTSKNLESIMYDFTHGKFDVLVATMIIENGLDIPSVNTMLVNRADAFGLAQLYQLRGRVGRSTQKAYCTFLIPARRALTENAMKRLRAIAEFDELGSGFALAMRDLEIRGAGNILGREQSGFLVSIGFEMYCRLLEEAVRELKGLPLEERPEPRLSTDADTFLPDDYVEEAEQKVAFYKRLADCRDTETVDTLEAELLDRFGRLALPAEALFDLRRVRILGADLGMLAISIRKEKIEFELAAPPAPGTLKEWMQRIKHPVEFSASGRFVLKAKGELGEALMLLQQMAGVPLTRHGKE